MDSHRGDFQNRWELDQSFLPDGFVNGDVGVCVRVNVLKQEYSIYSSEIGYINARGEFTRYIPGTFSFNEASLRVISKAGEYVAAQKALVEVARKKKEEEYKAVQAAKKTKYLDNKERRREENRQRSQQSGQGKKKK